MNKAGTITSAANPLLKDVRRAIARGGLTEQGWCVAETFHLLDEALRSPSEVHAVLASESARTLAEARLERKPGIDLLVLPDALFQRLAATETSQGVIALVKPPLWNMAQLFGGGRALVVVLDSLQDPGNAGTIIRTCEAFGATGALFLKGTASPYNPKTLRAAAGSLFRVPFLHGVEASLALSALRENHLDLYAAVPPRPGAAVPALSEIDLRKPCALAIGSEAHGVGVVLREVAREVSIPTSGVESLNAAVAAGILLYEAQRQRTLRK
ncbi:MAG TPA: RNA methyltransferase [Bryobacteraceae bacterium]